MLASVMLGSLPGKQTCRSLSCPLSVCQSACLCCLSLDPSTCLKNCRFAVNPSVRASVSLTTSTQQFESPAMLRALTHNFLVRGIFLLRCLHGCSLSLQGAWRRGSTTSSTRWIRCRRAWLMLTRPTSARSALPCLSTFTHWLLHTHLCPLDAPAVPPVPCGTIPCLSILTHCLLHTHLCPLDAPAVPPVPCGSTIFCPIWAAILVHICACCMKTHNLKAWLWLRCTLHENATVIAALLQAANRLCFLQTEHVIACIVHCAFKVPQNSPEGFLCDNAAAARHSCC